MTTIRPAEKDDLERVIALRGQAFNIPTAGRERARNETILEQIRVADDGKGVVATARAIPFGHFFGGRAIPAAGIAGVAVAAEARGKGLGTAIMREVLAEQRAAGVPISSLYPSTIPIYRQCGYGMGSTRAEWKAKLRELPQSTPADVDVEPFDISILDEINEFYEGYAKRTNGFVVRDKQWWDKTVFRGWDDAIRYPYLVREAGAITGYVIYQLDKSEGDEWRSTLWCRDLIWESPRAARALISLMSLHRSTSVGVQWIGQAIEPLLELMPDHTAEIDYTFPTMIRLLDVPAAFEARGYPSTADAALTIEVNDPLFAENNGPWSVEVNDGSAKVASADSAEAKADVQTWGSLWTGFLHPRDAVRLGALEATERALDTLEQIFAGPTPWISDFF